MTWRWVVLSGALSLWLSCQSSDAFCPLLHTASPAVASSSTALFGMNRKGRRKQKKQQQQDQRSKNRLREILDDDDTGKASAEDDPVYMGSGDDDDDDDKDMLQEKPPTVADTVAGGNALAERVARDKASRPEVSQIVIDEETGEERILQGQKVMDVVTRKAVKLSDLGPMYRLAQMFPGVPPDVREKLRMDWTTVQVPEMIDRLREACSTKLDDGTVGIPPMPSVANKGIDFIIANRDYLGQSMKRCLVRMMLRSQWQEDLDAARDYRTLARHFFLMENHISAPFRQCMLDAEERVGPNFGNLDLKSYCGKELYERTADYLVLKGMVSHWSKKYRDAEAIEAIGPKTKKNFIDLLCTGDPKRFLANSQVIWEKPDVERILAMALKMCNAYVDTPELFNDLPVEVRFFEKATAIQDGTTLRQYMTEEFCPAEGIEPAGLREGLRRLLQQLDNMQVDPYEDIWHVLDRIIDAVEKGTEDDVEKNPYLPYIGVQEKDGPGFFQTYTFDSPPQSIIRFLDQRLEEATEEAEFSGEDFADNVAESVEELFNFGEVFKLPTPESDVDVEPREGVKQRYKVPEARACGRPHELGWLDNIKEERDEKRVERKPGRIIFEEE